MRGGGLLSGGSAPRWKRPHPQVALSLAVRGRDEEALVFGVNLVVVPSLHRAYGAAGMLSGQGRSFAFDSRASGFARAEGVGAARLRVVWRRESDDEVQVAFASTRHGGRAASLTAPRGSA